MARINPDDLAALDTGAHVLPHAPEVVEEALDRLVTLRKIAPWAAETLDGIREAVERTGRVTPAQYRALDNIEAAADRQTDRPYTARGSSRQWNGPPAVRPGHCRRCRRLLTDPESIKLGIGPECRELEANGE